MYKALSILVFSLVASAMCIAGSTVSFPLTAANQTNALPSASNGASILSWSVSFPSNVWGTAVLYKRYRGSNILVDSLTTTNGGKVSFLGAPVRFSPGDSFYLDLSGLSGISGGYFNATAE